MSETRYISPTERAIYRSYDQQRRAALTRGIAPTFAAIIAILLIILNLDLSRLVQSDANLFNADRVVPTLFIVNPALILCIGLFILGAFAVTRDRVQLGTVLTVVATNVAVIAIEITWSFGISGYDFVAVGSFAAFLIAIVLAGVLGDTWMVIATTILMNLVVVFVGLLAHAPHPRFEEDSSIADLANAQLLINISGTILVQWAVAAVMVIAGRTYNRSLQELGDVRVQVERAKQLDDLKDQFISSINHELRSPVMAMQGYLELLRLTADNAPPEKRSELIQRASRASDNLSYLLTSILDARRLDNEAKDFVPSAVNVRETLTASAQLLDPREGVAGERDLRIIIPPDLLVWGEPVRMQQIFTNLLSNAIKYSETGTPIEVVAQVKVTPADRKARQNRELQPHVEIRFRDYGLGVPPDQAPLLFQRFVRLQRDLASTTIGNGLGLYLCRILAEAMGGAIRVESDGIPGNGSTFILTLPVPPAKALAPRLTKPDLTQVAAGL